MALWPFGKKKPAPEEAKEAPRPDVTPDETGEERPPEDTGQAAVEPEPQPEAAREPAPEPQPVAAPAPATKAPVFARAEDTPAPEPEPARKPGFFARLTRGLTRSSSRLSEGIGAIFTKRKLDDDTLEELEELLISADLGVKAASRITAALAKGRFGKELAPEEVRGALAAEIARTLEPVAKPLPLRADAKPYVIMFVGVNGTGKTTTIGKLASQLKGAGLKVMLAAGDTFRAAAIEQLQVWGERSGLPVVSGKVGADAAGLAYDALTRAKAEGMDVLMIDTAGRLQNKTDLMAELQKIGRVVKKIDVDAPHATLLVLDATTGQNAINQAEVFREMADVTGLVVTKLDGSAKGGVLVSIAEQTGLPVHAVGVGEGIDDLQPFDPMDYARAITGAAPGTS
ncbi:signal recognition particle-docking protein FtsY [Futiania mangrovi]|uniref:Signal recognition particle receptor FtsY n=1 Tax=Futiania mangrovi TaxID=2959716 RepID=A0A9J6PE11_9PROT|nr:signal recognition particle-docking protein FtsY [Futiania mangrovii]MCP1336638.1 signal recognition particle-docking protein FtsY [Futiania mangrovii]